VANVAGAIIKSMAAHERKASDAYMTRDIRAIHGLLDVISPPLDRVVFEPACGNGDISRVLHQRGYKTISRDLRHTGYGEGGHDYLESDETDYSMISNPPFNLAHDFIRHALVIGNCPWLALLLKADFWNSDVGRRLWLVHPPTGMVPVPWRIAFLKAERGNSPMMNCSWWIWERGKPPLFEIMERGQGAESHPNLTLGVALALMLEAAKENAEARRAYNL